MPPERQNRQSPETRGLHCLAIVGPPIRPGSTVTDQQKSIRTALENLCNSRRLVDGGIRIDVSSDRTLTTFPLYPVEGGEAVIQSAQGVRRKIHRVSLKTLQDTLPAGFKVQHLPKL